MLSGPRLDGVNPFVYRLSLFVVVTPQIQHRNIPNIKLNGVDTPPSPSSPFSTRNTRHTPTTSNLLRDTSPGSVRSLQIGKVRGTVGNC